MTEELLDVSVKLASGKEIAHMVIVNDLTGMSDGAFLGTANYRVESMELRKGGWRVMGGRVVEFDRKEGPWALVAESIGNLDVEVTAKSEEGTVPDEFIPTVDEGGNPVTLWIPEEREVDEDVDDAGKPFFLEPIPPTGKGAHIGSGDLIFVPEPVKPPHDCEGPWTEIGLPEIPVRAIWKCECGNYWKLTMKDDGVVKRGGWKQMVSDHPARMTNHLTDTECSQCGEPVDMHAVRPK